MKLYVSKVGVLSAYWLTYDEFINWQGCAIVGVSLCQYL